MSDWWPWEFLLKPPCKYLNQNLLFFKSNDRTTRVHPNLPSNPFEILEIVDLANCVSHQHLLSRVGLAMVLYRTSSTQLYFNSQKETGMQLHNSAPVGLVLNNGCLVLLSKSPWLWRIVSELCSIQPILFSHSCAPCIIPNLAIGGWSPNSGWVVCLISLSVDRLSGIPWSCVVIITIISSPSWCNRYCS